MRWDHIAAWIILALMAAGMVLALRDDIQDSKSKLRKALFVTGGGLVASGICFGLAGTPAAGILLVAGIVAVVIPGYMKR